MDDPAQHRPGSTWLLLFAVSLGFWLLLSGQYEPLYLGAGVLCSALVAHLTWRLEHHAPFVASGAGPLFHPQHAWVRFPVYVPWLLGQMVRSALGVAWVLVHPKLPISPVLARLPTRLRGPMELTTYANSITLTPGTVTVDTEGGDVIVHALTRAGVDELRGGAMERRVGWTFGRAAR